LASQAGKPTGTPWWLEVDRPRAVLDHGERSSKTRAEAADQLVEGRS